MLTELVHMVTNNDHKIFKGTLFCNNLLVTAELLDLIEFFEDNNILENTDYEKKIGTKITLELSLARLNSFGFYESREAFITKSKYDSKANFYLYDIGVFNSGDVPFVAKYNAVLRFLNSIKQIAKHTFTDVDIDISIVVNDKKSSIIPLTYSADDVEAITVEEIEKIDLLTVTFSDINSEKRLLFVNELMDFVTAFKEDTRFSSLIRGAAGFYEKCIGAYQYYLRDFSFNKLKLELDTKALEFMQKIQGVINDSQTKLIAIPTAFVLAFSTFDYDNPRVAKNLVAIVSLFLFSYLIQIFINNQKSTLKFLGENIKSFLETFDNNEVERISNKFSIAEDELNNQNDRIASIEVLLWVVPIILLAMWVTLRINQK
ncbi:MAG TPA: hypothetical protein VF622_02110 [Segetibacter sp.]